VKADYYTEYCCHCSLMTRPNPDTQMDLIHFEDVAMGDAEPFGDYEMTKEEVIEFAGQFDPQPFHLDEEAAKKTLLGGLSASGWHTAAVSMKLLYESFLTHAASMGGPGIDELKWVKPVRPGDRLSLRRSVLGKKESLSRPDLGIIHNLTEVVDQNGDVVMRYRNPIMLRRRGADQHLRAPELPRKAAIQDPADLTTSSEPPFFGRYFEDLAVGQRADLDPFTFDKEAITAFARKYDPQPFHVDEEAARQSHFGGLVASGWHTGAAYMRQLIAQRKRISAKILAQGGTLPIPGPSPGFNNLLWRTPVYAGDTLRFSSEIVAKRPVSRPGWGLVFFHNKAVNQDDRRVFEFEAIAFWQMRP
jgi:acyl dehydratase